MSSSDDKKMVQMFKNNPEMTRTQAKYNLEATGTPVLLSIVKPVLGFISTSPSTETVLGEKKFPAPTWINTFITVISINSTKYGIGHPRHGQKSVFQEVNDLQQPS